MKRKKNNHKLIIRIKGGLGNQLFCYAAARRLALKNNSELVIDNITGFTRDKLFCRQYELDHFKIPFRKATYWETMRPFERFRRGFAKLIARKSPIDKKRYIEQYENAFYRNILDLKINRNIYLDGLWQSEDYFSDVSKDIRKELQIEPPTDKLNLSICSKIEKSNSICVHIRIYDKKNMDSNLNLGKDYYCKAISSLVSLTKKPHFFIFSETIDLVNQFLPEKLSDITFVNNNDGFNAYADLWLMSKCKHFIISNSTLSWWGAWLSEYVDKRIIAPKNGFISMENIIPKSWIKL